LADREAYQAEDLATIASAGSVCKTIPIPFADGKVHNTLYYVSGFRNADGSPGGLVGTFSDLDSLPTATPLPAGTTPEEAAA
jgi:two-component system sensor histidine kinase/response regulator